MNNKKTLILYLLSLSLFFLLSNCSSNNTPSDTPINALERARKNVDEGRGISIKNALKRGSTTFEFSSSNPLWRASLEVLEFMPLSTVDYAGGVIITDWYSSNNTNDQIKINLRFLTNEIRSDSIKIIIHQRICNNDDKNCTLKVSNSKIKEELLNTIIKKAVILEQKDKSKK